MTEPEGCDLRRKTFAGEVPLPQKLYKMFHLTISGLTYISSRIKKSPLRSLPERAFLFLIFYFQKIFYRSFKEFSGFGVKHQPEAAESFFNNFNQVIVVICCHVVLPLPWGLIMASGPACYLIFRPAFTSREIIF